MKKNSLQFTKRMFYGGRNAALEDREQAGWIAPLDAEGSDLEVDDPEDYDVNDPSFIPDNDLEEEDEFEEPSTSRCRQG